MWKLGLRPRYSFSGNIYFKFSAFCLCSAGVNYIPQSGALNLATGSFHLSISLLTQQSRQSARLFLQSSELGPLHPLVPGGTHSLAGEEVGGPNSEEGTGTCGTLVKLSKAPKVYAAVKKLYKYVQHAEWEKGWTVDTGQGGGGRGWGSGESEERRWQEYTRQKTCEKTECVEKEELERIGQGGNGREG